MKVNPKHKTLRSKQTQNSKLKNKFVLDFGFWILDLFRISDFGFRILILASLWSLVFGLWSIAYTAEDISSFPVEVNGDQVEYFETGKKVVAKGNVLVAYKDIRMTCKTVTAFLESKEAIAEGDVVVTRGESILKGENIKYNFESETGVISSGTFKSDVWYGGGKRIEKVGPDELDVTQGYITTCDLAKPHYKIQSRRVRIYFGKRVVAKNVTFNVGGVPILYLPVYSQPINENFPKVNFVPGRDKNWGTYLLSSYRYNLSDDVKGNLHLDYRQNKGFGEGVDYSFKTRDFGKGYIRAYYTDERDKAGHTEKERWRAQYRHKWEMRPDTTVILEYHRMKDRSFIKDYFYREEFEREPQPESLISLAHARSRYTANILAQQRVNRFFTEIERLPEAQLNLKNQRLTEGLPFFYKSDFNVANLNRKTADSNQDNNVIRADTYNQLSVPLRLAHFFSIDPYAGTRQTFYTREQYTNEDRFRGALYSGVDLSTNFYKIYAYPESADLSLGNPGSQGDAMQKGFLRNKANFLNLDINGLRHIFTPTMSYYYIQKPTLLPERLYEFDTVDTLDEKNGIGLALENKLQTKRFLENELDTVELARWLVETDYLLHLEEGGRFSNILSDLEFRPYSWLFMKQTALYDPKWKDLKSLNTDVVAGDSNDKWRLGLGHRYEEKASSQLTTEAQARLTPKWKCRVFERYEFKGGDFKEQEYSITRDLHCWEMELTYSVRDAHTFWVVFRLKAFPELPLKLGTSYYKPRTGAGNE
jgi:lipopolysaccharide assembly outer membrane protein LptD (OstA)